MTQSQNGRLAHSFEHYSTTVAHLPIISSLCSASSTSIISLAGSISNIIIL